MKQTSDGPVGFKTDGMQGLRYAKLAKNQRDSRKVGHLISAVSATISVSPQRDPSTAETGAANPRRGRASHTTTNEHQTGGERYEQ